VGDDGVVKESVPRDVSGGQCGQLSQTAYESEEPLHLPALRDFPGQGLRHDRSIHPARGLSRRFSRFIASAHALHVRKYFSRADIDRGIRTYRCCCVALCICGSRSRGLAGPTLGSCALHFWAGLHATPRREPEDAIVPQCIGRVRNHLINVLFKSRTGDDIHSSHKPEYCVLLRFINAFL
jgi:hypothetical protein